MYEHLYNNNNLLKHAELRIYNIVYIWYINRNICQETVITVYLKLLLKKIARVL